MGYKQSVPPTIAFKFDDQIDSDPCTVIAGQPFVLPAKALTRLKSLPFKGDIASINSTTYPIDYDFNRAVYNFTTQLNNRHTCESLSPSPTASSPSNIPYAGYFPNCYSTFQNFVPTPLVSFTLSFFVKDDTQSVLIGPDTPTLVPLIGPDTPTLVPLIGPAFASFLPPTVPSPFNNTISPVHASSSSTD
ncbi:hypothetical protein BDY19DRAFT_748050 [Irpex rosettiformis]|uniref:Uncharacterized protein n=1 Tax=Irpex rosettiformis TaxID=378272 RepID=A0ACB8U7G4_9APHY|nr:hypothetical protein BDY19DRAFT_748050 [Irpex rosettiformis]